MLAPPFRSPVQISVHIFLGMSRPKISADKKPRESKLLNSILDAYNSREFKLEDLVGAKPCARAAHRTCTTTHRIETPFASTCSYAFGSTPMCADDPAWSFFHQATKESLKYECSAVETPKVDDEQEFVDFFLSKAGSPLIRGQPLKTRRVAVFGEKYHWGGGVTFPINALPLSFRKWCVANKYTGFNSVLVNVYEDKSSNIAWHMDATDSMQMGEVVSISFAAHRKHRKKPLANFEFRWPDKKDPAKKKTSTVLLEHGTAIRFDAVKHKQKKCEHRVAKTLYPRVNVTLRRIKKPA